MADMIDRKALIEDFKDKVCWHACGRAPHEICFAPCDEMRCIINAPAFSPKQGEWIEVEDDRIKCSLCGKEICYDANFCPACGVRMRGEEE